MAIDPRFVQLPVMQMQLWDKDLNVPLAAGKVYFFEDDNRTVPKNVYELTGSYSGGYNYVSLGAVLTLSAIGTFVDLSGNNNVPFLYPFTGTPAQNTGVPENYFIEVYSSTGVFQFSVQGTPFNSVSVFPTNTASTSENILSNPQFVNVLFPPAGQSITTSGTGTITPIAPDWSIITNGNGSFKVTQIAINASTITNPSYVLQITNITGYSTPIILNQTLVNSSRTLANDYVSGTFIAASTDGGLYPLTMSYVPSATGTPQTICSGTTLTTGFELIANNTPVLITPPNTGAAPSATLSIQISIPIIANIQISSIQACSVATSTESIPYIEESSGRQIDHLFHYYQPQLNFKPINSYLAGWDFPLNPQQINGPTVAASGSNAIYTWDQTILYQSIVSTLATSASANENMVITSSDGTNLTQGALIQYLDINTINDMLNYPLCVNVEGSSTVSGGLVYTVSLWYTTAVAISGMGTTGLNLITTLDANGYPTSVAAGWTEIKRANGLGNASGSLTSSLSNMGFNGWNTVPTLSGTATYFAIVVGTAAIPNTKTLSLTSISLQPGYISTIPAPLSVNETIAQCGFYFESSYNIGVKPGTSLQNISDLTAHQQIYNSVATTWLLRPTSFGFVYRNINRSASPVVNFYAPVTGTSGAVYGFIYTGGAAGTSNDAPIGNWSVLDKGAKSIVLAPATATGIAGISGTNANTGFITWHYTVDGRLGLVN